MKSWYSVSLGDGMTAAAPSAEIEEAFRKTFAGTAPSDAAVFTRLESEGRLHCEVIAYFSPAAADLALEFDAEPCDKPVRSGLGLLAGAPEAWATLFPESAGEGKR